MDDIVIIAPNKEIAREWLAQIKVFLQERLHLETNQKTKIFYVRQGVNATASKSKRRTSFSEPSPSARRSGALRR